jgi:L-rhamnose mutarotase
MTRYVLTVNLRDDPAAIAEYVEYHRNVWPEVIQSLRECGVEEMDIHLLGRRLVMIVEMRDGRDFRDALAPYVAAKPRVAEWERLMKSLQEPVPGTPSGEWWAAMEPVFTLNGNGAAPHAKPRAGTA